MIKDKIIGYCNSLGLDTLGFIPCRRFEELVEFYKYRKENNLENEFEEKEIEMMEALKISSCSLGKRILRSETAPLYMLSIIGYAREIGK